VLLVVGRIGRAHGVLGEATVEVRTDLPDERFYEGAVLATDPTKFGPLTIESARGHNGVLLLKFKEIKDRTAIEKLRDVLLMAEVDVEEEFDNEDEFHVQQLLGATVKTVNGEYVGTLTDVINLPGQDLLAVQGATGEILIPFVIEIVPTVDIANKVITIDPPEGLLNLAEAKEGKADGE
jgi:16S rRNA processing protein RimM